MGKEATAGDLSSGCGLATPSSESCIDGRPSQASLLQLSGRSHGQDCGKFLRVGGRKILPHIAGEGTEAQESEDTCSGFHTWCVAAAQRF